MGSAGIMPCHYMACVTNKRYELVELEHGGSDIAYAGKRHNVCCLFLKHYCQRNNYSIPPKMLSQMRWPHEQEQDAIRRKECEVGVSIAYTNLAGFSHGYAVTTPGGDGCARQG